MVNWKTEPVASKWGSLTVRFDDVSIRAADHRGAGTVTAYRVEHHPGLVLHVGRLRRDGISARTFYFVASRVVDGRQVKLRKPLGQYPALKLDEAAREMNEGRDLFAETAACCCLSVPRH